MPAPLAGRDPTDDGVVISLQKLRRFDEAQASYDRVLKIDSENREALTNVIAIVGERSPAVDLVLLVMNRRGADKLISNQVSLGADMSVAAGPVGRAASFQPTSSGERRP